MTTTQTPTRQPAVLQDDDGEQLAAAARRSAARRRRTSNLALQIGVLVLVLGLWTVVARNEWVTPLLLPQLGDVVASLRLGLVEGQWWPHIWITLQETVIGFTLGVILGFLVGALFAFVTTLRTAFYPYVIALMSFPKIAIAPLLIVAFGYDMTPKIIIATLLAFFPVMTSATAGLSEVDRDELNLMRSMGSSRTEEMRYLRIPNAMSYIFPSLDVALIGALLGAVAAELIGSQGGLGYLLSQGQALGDVPGMYGVLLLLAALGASMHVLISAVRRVLPMSIVPKSE